MDYIADLHEMCEIITNEIADANGKIRAAGGKLSAADLDYVDKLTHALKSIKAVVAMEEDSEGYSNRGSYADGGSYRAGRGSGYARGRGSYANRDSMGRYSSRGYSRDGGLTEELRGLMDDAPNEAMRREIQRLVDKMEHM